MFDFVFVLRARSIGPNRIERWIDTEPTLNTIIRQRLPKPLPAKIDIPQDGGGWKNLMDAIQMCLDKAPVGVLGAQQTISKLGSK